MGKDENKNVNGQGQENPNTDENGAGTPPQEGQKEPENGGLFRKIGNGIKKAGSRVKLVITKKHNVSVADVVIAVGVAAGAAIGIKTIYERGKKDGQKELGMDMDDNLMLEDKNNDIFEASVVEEPETEEVEVEPEYEEDEEYDYEEVDED